MPCKILHSLLIIHLALVSSSLSQTSGQLRANLYSFNADGTTYLSDGNLTMYNVENSNAVDERDAVKMSNFGENFGILRGTTTLAIERRKTITTVDTIFFRMWNMRKKSYKLELITAGLVQSELIGVLEDKYLNTAISLNLNAANSITFTISNDIASAAPDRFRILFSLPAPSFRVLPITFTGIKAFKENDNIKLEWTVENEKDISEYQIHKSVNGQQFLTIAKIVSKGKSTSSYSWTDFSAMSENNFYRICSIDRNGKIQFSNVAKVSSDINILYSLYPNPVTDGSISIQIYNSVKGIYTLRLINNYGQLVYLKQLMHSATTSTQSLQFTKNISEGNYILEIITPDNSKITRKILVQ